MDSTDDILSFFARSWFRTVVTLLVLLAVVFVVTTILRVFGLSDDTVSLVLGIGVGLWFVGAWVFVGYLAVRAVGRYFRARKNVRKEQVRDQYREDVMRFTSFSARSDAKVLTDEGPHLTQRLRDLSDRYEQLRRSVLKQETESRKQTIDELTALQSDVEELANRFAAQPARPNPETLRLLIATVDSANAVMELQKYYDAGQHHDARKSQLTILFRKADNHYQRARKQLEAGTE